ncbi:MAG TPA: prolyl oligopeptidase family serine peptidase [Patescibacteria group bacterium]|nr:prolyl oligopeptidase family serine peptidase [Patescibacteria group bacterium]
MSDSSLKPRLLTAAIFACAVAFFAYVVIGRLSEMTDKHPNAPKRIVIKPFNDLPMEEATQEFQRFALDVTTKTHIRNYSYYLYTPFLAEHSNKKFPLVMVLHNAKGFAYAAKYLAARQAANENAAFIFVPMLNMNNPWTLVPQDSSVLMDEYPISDAVLMVRRLAELYPVDTSRIYVVGCSAGGIGAYAAARYFPDVFAAAIPISGGWKLADAPNLTRVPLWVEHGDADTTIPSYNDFKLAHAIQADGGSAMYTEFPHVGHECSLESFYSTSIFDWMFKQRLKSPLKQ